MTSGNRAERLAPCLAFLAEEMPDLVAVVEAWPTLPQAVRSKVLTIVRAAPRQGSSKRGAVPAGVVSRPNKQAAARSVAEELNKRRPR